MMLLEEKFFDAMEGAYKPTATPMVTKIERLFALLKDGNRRLILARTKTIADFEKQIVVYKAQATHAINQTKLPFADVPDAD